ncbi:helix-turn-helix domain-containing protein [Marinicella litoralis]|uniref:Putative Fis-like DNA-binding protein n=1 Tax=Marinicella litoralis TaxID=644220 RepID=A0A4R6XXU9_9GAMM|nr:helix-turn-helix domain-containing protein [Marinicella litoralis]TDR23310.1 Fis family transcriptional regulator [Marinicella litoralis]
MSANQPNQKAFTRDSVRRYLESLNGHKANQLYDLVIEETERGMILEVLKWCKGNRSNAADILGITRTTLRNKMNKLKIS